MGSRGSLRKHCGSLSGLSCSAVVGFDEGTHDDVFGGRCLLARALLTDGIGLQAIEQRLDYFGVELLTSFGLVLGYERGIEWQSRAALELLYRDLIG